MPALGITDHQGLYGAVRFSTAAEAAGLHPVIGLEIELLDAGVPDPGGIVVPASRPWRPGRRPPVREEPRLVTDGRPQRPRPERARLPGHRRVVKEDHRGVGEPQRGPHLLLLARDAAGWRSLCRLVSRANLAGTKAVPAFTHDAAGGEPRGGRGAVRLPRRRARAAAAGGGSRGRPGGGRAVRGAVRDGGVGGDVGLRARAGAPPPARRRLARLGDRPAGRGAGAAGRGHQRRPLRAPGGPRAPGRRDGDPARPVAGRARATCGGRTASRTSRARPSCSRCRPATRRPPRPPTRCSHAVARGDRGVGGDRGGLPRRARVRALPLPGLSRAQGRDAVQLPVRAVLGGRPAPLPPADAGGREAACARARRHRADRPRRVLPHLLGPDAVREGAGDPGPGTGERGGLDRGLRAGDHAGGPIRHELLFERFINEGRTAYPDVDIDFSSERREEVIQYVYERYGAEHTGMVCNLVTYRARSAVREVGYALGFPRPLVDRVAKALETYDSVMVRRDLEAEGGFAAVLRAARERARARSSPTEAAAASPRRWGSCNHARGGKARGGPWDPPTERGDESTEPPWARRLDRRHGPAEHAECRSSARCRPGASPATPDGPERATGRSRGCGTSAAGAPEAGRGPRRRAGPGRAGSAPGDDEGGPGDSPVSVALDPGGGADTRAGALA